MNFYFETKNATFALIDKKTGKYLAFSFFAGTEGSGYLTINSSNPRNPDYAKFSFHPRSGELRFSFTNEIWKYLNRPNQERVKSREAGIQPNQVLVRIYVDRSALFRTGDVDPSFTKAFFPASKPIELRLALENGRLTLEAKAIEDTLSTWIEEQRQKIYERIPELNDGAINGCAQLFADDRLPWRVVVIGT